MVSSFSNLSVVSHGDYITLTIDSQSFDIDLDYNNYIINTTITNGFATGDTTITSIGTATVIIEADSGYELPEEVSVVGANYTYYNYDGTAGEIVLSNATDNVVINIICNEIVVPM